MEQMYAYKCTKCGKLHHPRYIVCQNPDCDGREFEQIPLEGNMMPWLNFGIVEFENGVRATGQIGFDDGIKSGMELVSSVGVIRTKVIKYKETVEEPVYGFVFQKA